ncbi:hypothetical protein BHE74_00037873 [Ensete ventricosum]|nr:hypothetical protein BHE74_00037873 [Ensete ventricosum]
MICSRCPPQTAVVPGNSTEAEPFFWWGLPNYEDIRPQFHIFMHFAELQPLALGQPRNFTVDLNGNPWWHPFSPTYLLSDYIYSTSPYDMYQYNFSIKKTATSTLPPIINALETYTVMQLTENATDSSDELNKGFITGIWFLSLVTARIETIWHLSMSTCLKGHYEINCKIAVDAAQGLESHRSVLHLVFLKTRG